MNNKLHKLDMYYFYEDKKNYIEPNSKFYAGSEFKYTDRPIKYLSIQNSNGFICIDLIRMKIKRSVKR